MDAKRLLIFGTVVRAGSLAAAARELGWTQPAVSQHVRALERELRVPLIVRSAHGAVATEAGLVVLEHANAVAARLRAADAEVAAIADSLAGSVRLATFPTAGATLVPAAMQVMTGRTPGLEVRLTDAEPAQALALLELGQVDAALVFRYDDEPARPGGAAGSLVEHPLGDEAIRLVLPAGHRLAGRTSIQLADLADERWVGGCVQCSEHLLRVCARAGFTPDVRHSTDDYVIVQSLVAQGLAVALLPELALRSVLNPGVEVRDVVGAGSRRLAVTHHADAAGTPALRGLLAALGVAGR
ncbi:LysR family transcriptional regulator [Pengzhenrongella sicca]|uniref:LysR family transcriptional regulator n=1 Tax=Pengzhenrongella sicca TaxID=2819238 RepID=A0A8A4Z8N2_9MICO|nr:LysR family transcriptional regulator [Pengzhenrongella sicca]QTE28204.1 LysR family transcriptional regulator [Pengzhenrongella sicca]